MRSGLRGPHDYAPCSLGEFERLGDLTTEQLETRLSRCKEGSERAEQIRTILDARAWARRENGRH